MMNSERMEPKAVIAVRNDLAKQAAIKALDVKGWVNHTETTTEGATIQIKTVYLPHRTSKEWSEVCLLALTPVKSVLCGDMNYTPGEDMVRGVDTSQMPDIFKDKWNQAPNHGDWQVAHRWPSRAIDDDNDKATIRSRLDDEKNVGHAARHRGSATFCQAASTCSGTTCFSSRRGAGRQRAHDRARDTGAKIQTRDAFRSS